MGLWNAWKNSGFLWLFVLFVLLVMSLFAVFLLSGSGPYVYTVFPYPMKESTRQLSNPDRGFYRLYTYLIDGAGKTPGEIRTEISWNRENTLALVEINLQNYRNGVISAEGLAQIRRILTAWAESGQHILLRCLYDWEGKALETEPKRLEIILKHMEQLGPLINSCQSSIFVLQGCFIGNWGELHGSRYVSEEILSTLFQKLREVTSPEIFLSTRTPAQWRALTGRQTPPAQSDAFSGRFSSRLGLFNDALLSSVTDYGTYDSGSVAGEDAVIRAKELEFQDELCRFLPNGGETIFPNALNDLENAVDTFARIHISYLNEEYDQAVLQKWKDTIFHSESESVWEGSSGYDYIAAHLGYRYVMTGLSSEIADSRKPTLIFSVRNTGFANAYRRFPVRVTLLGDNGSVYICTPESDNRFWNAGEETRIRVGLPRLRRREYAVFFSLLCPEDTEKQVAFANDSDPTENGYLIGTLRVH